MTDLFWLLLPIAAASSWWMAKREYARREDARTSSSEYVRGLNYLLDDKPDRAIEVFLSMVVDRDTAETHLALGNLFRRRGEMDLAIHIHRNLVVKTSLTDQQRSRAMLDLGEDYMCAGLLDRAEILFSELVKQPNHAAIALIRLIDIYEQEKDWRQAIAHCDRLETLTGQAKRVETAHYCCELAGEALQRGDVGEAREFIRQALERDANCVRAIILRGRMAMNEKRYAAAIAAFQTVAHQKRSYFSEVIAPLSECYNVLGRQGEWLDYLRELQENDHSGRVTAALVDLLVEQESEDSALRFLETELRNYPTLLGLRRLIELRLTHTQGSGAMDRDTLYRTSKHMFDITARYKCDRCGFVSKSLYWHCPSCKSWSSVKPIPDLVLKSNV